MLIVGQVSSEEERNEVTTVAQLVMIGQRFRYLARQQQKK